MRPSISVIIPTRGRPAKLAACLDRLSRQTLPRERFEVLVGIDGPDRESRAALTEFEANGRPTLVIVECPRVGIAGVKNRLIDRARGETLLFLNDDVEPDADLLAKHAEAHAEVDGVAMILGHSPWVTPDGETRFDRLLARSSMIFFYDQMAGETDRSRDWGYRHAWNLNLSIPRSAVDGVGGFTEVIANCCFEDLELAFRVERELGAPTLYRPDAAAPHNHRYTPFGYLDRERRLGYSAFGFAVAAPECAQATFRSDLRADSEWERVESFVAEASRNERDLLARFVALGREVIEDDEPDDWIASEYEAHLPLKRLAFAYGYLAARSGERWPGLVLPTDAADARQASLC
ncbi:MAG: glycosyltransferase family 2 protein [Phycisphaerales bacterium]